MVEYGGIFHPIWNGFADLIWILFVVAVVRTPTDRLPRGWRTKIYWIAGGTIFNVYAPGLVIPVGVVVAWALFVKRYRRSASDHLSTTAADQGYPFYPTRRPVAPQ